ncbi:MAG: carboxypeptidase-like regulatory domain-containing protein, partial [Chitinophagaceae bacterium]
MKRIILLLLFWLPVSYIANAQKSGIIAGKIIDARNNALLPGVTVIIGKSSSGKTSDVEGRFQLAMPAGNYSLTFSAVGYKTKSVTDIIVKEGAVEELNVVLEPQVGEMAAVVVTASARRESVASVLSLQRNNASISDGISSEAIKKSPDKNIGEVLKRVSGTSIQDDKFVVVRGLNDRYNTALINGAILPSTEPDRRAFSFDIVPSSMIDNILINKTASPNLPGDFSGGLIQIQTKDIPFKSFLSISVGAGYNSISTGKEFKIGQLNNTDYLGYDDGTRMMPQKFPGRNRYLSYNADATPERRLAASRLMRNNYGERYHGNALPSFNFQLTWGDRKNLKNGGTIGSVVALTYRNAQNISHNIRRDYQTPDDASAAPGNLFFDYRDTAYTFSTNMGLLANFAYKKGVNKIVLKNIANRTFDISNLHRSGYNYDNRQFVNVTGTVPVIKSLVSSQLEGDHVLGEKNSRLNWNINYSLTARSQPDYRVLPYAKNIDELNDKSASFKVVLRDTY